MYNERDRSWFGSAETLDVHVATLPLAAAADALNPSARIPATSNLRDRGLVLCQRANRKPGSTRTALGPAGVEEGALEPVSKPRQRPMTCLRRSVGLWSSIALGGVSHGLGSTSGVTKT